MNRWYEVTAYGDKPGYFITVFHDITRQKFTAEKLQQKESFLQNIIDNMIDMVSLTDLSGNFKFLGTSHKLLGYDLDFLIGRNVMEFVHPEDLPEVLSAFKKFLSGDKELSDKVEYRYRCADGSYLWFETMGKLLLDEKGNPQEILFSIRDVSEQRQYEKALKESEERFRSFVENASDIIYTLSEDGTFTYVSPNWKYILGHEVSEVEGKPFSPFVHPEDVHRCFTFLTNVLDTGQSPESVEYRVKHKDGTWRWHSSRGSIIKKNEKSFYIGTARDVTDRKQAEDALRRRIQPVNVRRYSRYNNTNK